MKIVMKAGTVSFEAELDDSAAARAIADALPLSSTVNKWGDEIYFDIGIDCHAERLTMDVEAGDLAYWPSGRCLCIFFGPTPASDGEKPVPASGVAPVGRTAASPETLRAIGEGERITVSATG